VYTELLVPGPDVDALDAFLDVYDTRRSPLPWACASLAAAAFALCRSVGGSKLKPLPDLYIGAHAAVANLSVLTRDPAPYRRYFPRLVVVAPRLSPVRRRQTPRCGGAPCRVERLES
jgi:predicted nucleic acid-binding protein